MPRIRNFPALRVSATIGVNAVVWIMCLKDADERQSTAQVLTFLEPFLQAMNVPFFKVEPQSANDLLTFFASLEQKAKSGLRPMIHIDTHGHETDGLYIPASDEDVSWQELADALRPINVAARNNVCVVSAACFSLQTIMKIKFGAPTPFFIMFAPTHAVTFGFVEDNVFRFYEDVFTKKDVMGAHERHLAPDFQQYHCQRLLLKALGGYLRDSCTGKGRRKWMRTALREKLGPGNPFPNTPHFRKIVRRAVLAFSKPNKALVDRYAKPFLMGSTFSIPFDEILHFVRTDAMRWNILMRRAARTKRRHRRVRHCSAKNARTLRRRARVGVRPSH